MGERVRRAPPRRWLAWSASCVGAAIMLWLAAQHIELLPSQLHVPHKGWLAVALALHLPYMWLRAGRLAFVLDPLVQVPAVRVRRSVLFGSGWISFLVISLLPLRLGELSRPILLARSDTPGIRLTEAVASVAVERVVDGLAVCTLLFVGLAWADAGASTAGWADAVLRGGRWMAIAFALAALLLVMWARDPEAGAAWIVRWFPQRGHATALRVVDVGTRFAHALRKPMNLRQGGRFLGWTVLYWLVTVAQLGCTLRACGLQLDAAQAAAIVAIVGLSIQLPGGPAQAGSFQLGAGVALALFLSPSELTREGSSFAATMYLLQLGGAVVFAGVGAGLLGWGKRRFVRAPVATTHTHSHVP